MSDLDNLTYTEMCAQPYGNCKFSAGLVDGHPVDTIYLTIEGEGREERTFLLRPDEAQAIIWVLSGALWSHEMGRMHKEQDEGGI